MGTPRLALLVVLSACGSGGTSPDDFFGEIPSAICEGEVACGGAPDVGSCEDALAPFDDTSTLTILAGVDDGVILYDEDAAEACLATLATDSDCRFPGGPATLSPCAEVFTGTLEVGEACVSDFECAGLTSFCLPADEACDPSIECCAGTCEISFTPVALGGECTPQGIGSDCDFGLVCAEGFCATPTPEDATCTDLFECEAFTYCDVTGEAPTCIRPAGTGEDCSNEELIPCALLTDECDEVSLTCVALPGPGETCLEECLGFATCIEGLCEQNPGLGEACGIGDLDPQCLVDLICDGGTCADLSTPGTACSL
jgi:hypothetical protein